MDAKLALREPYKEESGRYFSFKLKRNYDIEPITYPSPRKLLIVSNIQGNFRFFRKLLLQAGVIDRKYQWTFGEAHLVIAGNCLGENGSGVECLWLIYALEEKARKNGGYVHFILGRNELSNINGSWQRLHPKYADGKTLSKHPYVVLYNGNNELRRWLYTKNIIEKIGQMLISCNDISQEISDADLSLTQLNNLIRHYHSLKDEIHGHNLVSKLFQPSQHVEFSGQTNGIYHKFTTKEIAGHTYVYIIDKNIEHIYGKRSHQADVLMVKRNKCYKMDPTGKRESIHLPG